MSRMLDELAVTMGMHRKAGESDADLAARVKASIGIPGLFESINSMANVKTAVLDCYRRFPLMTAKTLHNQMQSLRPVGMKSKEIGTASWEACVNEARRFLIEEGLLKLVWDADEQKEGYIVNDPITEIEDVEPIFLRALDEIK